MAKIMGKNHLTLVQVTLISNVDIIIPPHNGIGSEEDSLGYIYRLVPKPPQKDFFQWVDQQVGLRFTAFFSSPKSEDTNRKFIITYYLNDNSLQIYEPPIRNSGMYEGKFLERNQYKKQDGTIYKPEDLVIGYDVKINGHWFHISDCDDFTKKWYADNTLWMENEQWYEIGIFYNNIYQSWTYSFTFKFFFLLEWTFTVLGYMRPLLKILSYRSLMN